MRVVGALLLLMAGAGCGGRSSRTSFMVGSTPAGGSSSQSTEDATAPAMTGGDAACTIVASKYDQSCAVDTDCRMISAGDYCMAGCLCGGSAISATAIAQFNADVAKTPLGSGAVQNLNCNCPGEFAPCCRQGQCVAGSDCLAAPDASQTMVSGPPDFTVLCIADAGFLDSGATDAAAVPGHSRWCEGPEVCEPINGTWECCVTIGISSRCVAP
jgi:hypothetical protein